MPQMTMVQAIQDALRVALREDPRVVLLGEDVGKNGGVFRVTEGLQAEFGAERVRRHAAGRERHRRRRDRHGALRHAAGRRDPVRRLHLSRRSTRSSPSWRRCAGARAGQYACPVVVRAPYGGGIRGGLYHSQSPEAYFCHTAGLRW